MKSDLLKRGMISGLLFLSFWSFNQNQPRSLRVVPPDDSYFEKSIDNQLTPTELVDVLLIDGICIDVSNATAAGTNGIAYFEKSANLDIGLDDGVVLTTGSTAQLLGPNTGTADASSDNNNASGDTDLNTLFNTITTNAVALEFDFIPSSSNMAFTLVFASEEYPEYVCSTFNDVMGVFINKIGGGPSSNFGYIPGTQLPISINSLNNGIQGSQGAPNLCVSLIHLDKYIDNSTVGSMNTSLDGYSVPITIQIDGMDPCSQYHFKIAIADTGDAAMDSAIFIKSESLVGGNGIELEAIGYNNVDNIAVEACEPAFFRFIRPIHYPLDIPYVLDLSYSGTATFGLDYEALPSQITIPAGDVEYLLPVITYMEGGLDMFEGDETIILTTSVKSCSCSRDFISSTLIIENREPYTIDVAICEGDSYTLPDGIEVTEGGSYTGPMLPDPNFPDCDIIYFAEITIAPNWEIEVDLNFCPGDDRSLPNGDMVFTEGDYDVEYKSQHGCDSLVTYHVAFREDILEQVDDSICEGEEYVLPGTYQIISPSAGEYNYSWTGFSQFGCDSTVQTNLEVFEAFELDLVEQFCEGEVYIGPNGQEYDSNTQQTFILTSLVTGCDSIVHLDLVFIEPEYTTESDPIFFCEEESVMLPDGQYVNEEGEYDVLFTSQYGCDSIVTYRVKEVKTEYARNSIRSCGVKEFRLPSGIVVSEEGTYIDTLQNVYGCDSIITTQIEIFNVVIPSAFTPNGNGENDELFVSQPDVCGIESFELQVYNRYGQMVFESYEIDHWWNGQANGEPASPGLYLYTGKFTLKDEQGNVEDVRLEGGVTLIR